MNPRVLLAFGLFLLGFLLVALIFVVGSGGSTVLESTGAKDAFSLPHRKLLLAESSADQPNRIYGERCTSSDILISQGPTTPLPSGIPVYAVEIMNVCATGCGVSRIHLACGWFSSVHLINPRVFKRLRYNDCLVNDGKPLANGGTLSFQYANTYPYPLSVSSVVCT